MAIIDYNEPINIEGYVQTRTPDKTELARLLVEAKGPNRNMTEFAKDCGSSPSTFSRILNCKISQPLDVDLLKRISEFYWKEMPTNKNRLLDSLLHANGMMPKSFLERKRSDPFMGGFVEEDERQFSRERDVKNAIIMNLLERGVGIRYLVSIMPDTGIHEVARQFERNAFAIKIEGENPEYQRFQIECLNDCIKVLRAGKENAVDPITGRDYQAEADHLLKEESMYFLMDAWEPESFKNLKNSIVFDDRGFYEAFYKLLENRKVNSWISLILVNLEKQIVIEEKFVQRKDGQSIDSLFDLPMLEK